VCLTYLLAQPECELLGITTVSGECEVRAELASAICTHAGRRVPIHAGLDAPLEGEQRQPEAPQKEALARWKHERGFEKGSGIDFMARTIFEHPGEVVLLTIGPLTNAAALFDAHPEAAAQLRALVMMGGAFRTGEGRGSWNEWNVTCDVAAAARVYATRVAVHRSVGLNVTVRATLPADEVRQRFTHERWKPALDMAEVWFRERPSLMFHDPLAAAVLFDEDIVRWNRGAIRVEDEGFTSLTLDPQGPHEAAAWVEPERFFSHFFSVAG
jgi:purine nucleosidase